MPVLSIHILSIHTLAGVAANWWGGVVPLFPVGEIRCQSPSTCPPTETVSSGGRDARHCLPNAGQSLGKTRVLSGIRRNSGTTPSLLPIGPTIGRRHPVVGDQRCLHVECVMRGLVQSEPCPVMGRRSVFPSCHQSQWQHLETAGDVHGWVCWAGWQQANFITRVYSRCAHSVRLDGGRERDAREWKPGLASCRSAGSEESGRGCRG